MACRGGCTLERKRPVKVCQYLGKIPKPSESVYLKYLSRITAYNYSGGNPQPFFEKEARNF